MPYTEGQNLTAKQAERVAYIDAHVWPGAAVATTATAGSQTPVSAPVATADFLIRTAPNAPETQEAKDRAARINNEKRQAADKPAGSGDDH